MCPSKVPNPPNLQQMWADVAVKALDYNSFSIHSVCGDMLTDILEQNVVWIGTWLQEQGDILYLQVVKTRQQLSVSLQCRHFNTRITAFVDQVNFCAFFLCLDLRLPNNFNLWHINYTIISIVFQHVVY